MVTGGAGHDTVAPGPAVARRRRRREHVDEDDSSDLSDESEEDAEGAQRAAQQIRFAKMPVRRRSDSSPIRSSDRKDGPELLVTSPSRRSTDGRLRRGSLGAVEAVKARARRDTATSSDLSSENELDPSYFQRRQVSGRNNSRSIPLGETHLENLDLKGGLPRGKNTTLHEDSDVDSVGSALSSELGETLDSNSILNLLVPGLDASASPPLLPGIPQSSSSAPQNISPKRARNTALLQDLPPPRPISIVEPVSLISLALRARQAKPSNPLEPFANLSGKGSPNPLWIKIYAPFSKTPDKPFEMPLDRTSKHGANVTVAEAIGLALWRYSEESFEPSLQTSQQNVNKWTMRMIEDGEVDYDFPALGRTRPISEFTANNNRGARGRSREKPFDEFALVEATVQQAEQNSRETPKFSPSETAKDVVQEVAPQPAAEPRSAPQPAPNKSQLARQNPVLGGQPFASALNNTSLTPADQPAVPTTHATPRMGVTKTLRIRYLDLNTQITTMEIPTDSYIAEILDHVCKRWNLDKAAFVLKVGNTSTVAPLDRTVEALGTRSDLDLVRRRFGAGPLSLTGSPGSSSPNAPLLIDIEGPKKTKKGGLTMQAIAQKQDLMSSASNYKRYNVIRKQLTSFTQSSQKVLAFDGDFLHLMPGETGKDSGKSTAIAFADVLRCKVSSKHAKLIRLVVRRATESKQYDLEARSAAEAQEIVDEVRKEMKLVT